MGYNKLMYTLIETEAYAAWFAGLRDRQAKARILVRLRRVEMGNLGDHKSVGEGVAELRLTVGAGYRIYYTLRNGEVIILLGGGDKSSQSTDIEQAKALLELIKKEAP